MNYEKLDLPVIPTELKLTLISDFLQRIKTEEPFLSYTNRYETEIQNVSYIANTDGIANLLNSGGVLIYSIPDNLRNQLVELFKDTIKNISSLAIVYQTITPGKSYVCPHIDDLHSRIISLIYVLDPGGNTVTTQWWDVKDEYKHLDIPETTIIPEDKLLLTDTVIVEKDRWYRFNHKSIHSVSNIEHQRLLISFIETP